VASQPRPGAERAGSQDAHVASRRKNQDRGQEEVHLKRNTVEEPARAVEGFDAARD